MVQLNVYKVNWITIGMRTALIILIFYTFICICSEYIDKDAEHF